MFTIAYRCETSIKPMKTADESIRTENQAYQTEYCAIRRRSKAANILFGWRQKTASESPSISGHRPPCSRHAVGM
jgi:hypothetical protein